MENDGTLNLLLVHDNVNEANRLASLLRNATYKVDPQYAGSTDALASMVQEHNWDLALAQYNSESVPFKTLFHQVRRLNKDIPIILITEEQDTTALIEGLRLGASDVVPMDADQLLLQVVSRTLYNLEQRRRLRYWKRRYATAEARCERLMENSRDALAIIQEGTYVYVNDTYANLFGYLDTDGMLLLPVIDTVSKADHIHFKKYLKPLSAEDAWDEESISFQGVTPDGNNLDVQARISQVEYQGEPALQVIITENYLSPLEATTENTGATPEITAIRLKNMLEQITSALRRAARTEQDSLLFYLRIDHFAELQEEFGINRAEEIVARVAAFIQQHVTSSLVLGRIREDSFILLAEDMAVDHGQALAEELCKAAAAQVYEIDHNQTASTTLSIGISVISEAATTAEGCIERCLKAIAQLEGGNGVQIFEAVFEPTAIDVADTDIIRFGRQLLEKHMLQIAYQPIIPLHGSSEEFYEVLMRPKVDSYPKDIPEDFITRVFKTEVALDIDRWVILETIKNLAEKRKTHPHTRLFVNLSPASLCDDQLIPWLKTALKAAGIPPQALIFELREIDVDRYLNRAAEVLQSLKKFNSQTALSHFGLSINPMQVFNKLSVDYVKLDTLVVEKARKDDVGMEAMTHLINQLRAEDQCIIVPFIENAAMIPTLWQQEVHYIEGHYIQAPSPTMDYEFSEEN